MKIVTDLSKFDKAQYSNLVVGLGNFDGVHLGHLAILNRVRERARQIGGNATVLTFREHPQKVLAGDGALKILTSLIHKLVLLEESGIDLCFVIDFSIEFSKTSAEEFVRDGLIGTLAAREICLGFNARFGHGREGDSSLMKKLAERYDFHFIETPPFGINGKIVSSSLIRSLIEDGKLDEAASFLGRPYSFFGTVVGGSSRGRKLGFPTANLDPHNEVMLPEGVYTAWVRIFDCALNQVDESCYHLDKKLIGDHLEAVLNYGRRPTFNDRDEALAEVHILDFDENLEGKTLEVEVRHKIRGEQRFDNAEALRKQIGRDIQMAQEWFEGYGKRRK